VGMGPVAVSAQEVLEAGPLKPTVSSAENTNLRLQLHDCEKTGDGMDCHLSATAKGKALVRYSKNSYLMQKGGAHIPVTWISIGGDGRNPVKYVAEYVELEKGLSTDIILRFEGDVGIVDALVADFGAGGKLVFQFLPRGQ